MLVPANKSLGPDAQVRPLPSIAPDLRTGQVRRYA
jgi:hypothetical protein